MKATTGIVFASVILGLMAPSAFGDRGGERIMRSIVTGMGTGSDPNRDSAESQAYDQAQTNANMYCTMGMIEEGSYERTSDACITQGDASDSNGITYFCTVSVKAICVVHY